MNNNRILNLPFPQTSGEPITKGFVEKYYGADYVNILTFKGKPGNVTIINKDDTVDRPVFSASAVNFRKGDSSYEISFSVTPKLPVDIYTYEMDVVLTTSRGYNITLWGDCGGSGYTASTKYKYWSWSYENKVQQNDAQGGYFHRGARKRVRIKGSFLSHRTHRRYAYKTTFRTDDNFRAR